MPGTSFTREGSQVRSLYRPPFSQIRQGLAAKHPLPQITNREHSPDFPGLSGETGDCTRSMDATQSPWARA
ncbi:hypothetical protein BOSEA31B_10750 [Hyphomicrobiales bacterium]|nr:hypothetical protein BOSEA31B_10750 [Hyphomicrobiales bacterium]CAH1700602.1 hypothetical protein BOSEA1005_20301 [Hyphomicrobiales bacterium]CAI0344450.1 hypothetical protein BO1005MUT1_330117 [Hyphomicrobiales bacterium]